MIPETALASIVGADNVILDERVLQQYASDMSFAPAIMPAAVVRPGDSAAVIEIVNLAKKTRTPLVPVSSGAPHFRGDTVPSTGGSVVVDLSRMKKVLHIDRKNRAAMFEAGTTFEELSPAIAEKGLRLNMPLLPRRSKSVAGSLLEREAVLMPKYHWDIADPLACTEVIFGTGEMFRTGAAAGSGTIEEQWAAGGSQKEAAGPSSASWYRLIQGSQGTMGIVTWVSARCELIPRLEEPFFIGSSGLEKILDMLHWLIRLRLVNECLVLNNTNLAMILASAGKGDYQSLRAALPPWVLFFNIAAYEYLSEERICGQVKDMTGLTQRICVEAVKSLDAVTARDFLKIVQKPSPEPYWKLHRRGGAQDILFLTLYDRIAGQVRCMYDAATAAGYPSTDLGVYLQPVVQGVNCHCEFNLFYDPAGSEESDRIKKLTHSATAELLAAKAYFSRPYGENARMICNRDAASAAALKKVKAIVDPENIMNPGKLCF
ncbi:MAG: FAD-binding oxidoreductase [Dehalococcoidales bacterium]|nr:FAD-binding oxidoreductase [Dehalococcoidales bacterium]